MRKWLKSVLIDILSVIFSAKLCCAAIVWLSPAAATSSWMSQGMKIESFIQPIAWLVLLGTNFHYWHGLYKCHKQKTLNQVNWTKAGFKGLAVIIPTLIMAASYFGFSLLPHTASNHHINH